MIPEHIGCHLKQKERGKRGVGEERSHKLVLFDYEALYKSRGINFHTLNSFTVVNEEHH